MRWNFKKVEINKPKDHWRYFVEVIFMIKIRVLILRIGILIYGKKHAEMSLFELKAYEHSV